MARTRLYQYFTENLSYKLVALCVTLILWMTILGRRDFVHVRDFQIQLVVPPTYQVLFQSEKTVQVRVSGSRMALRKFLDLNPLLEVEVAKVQEGRRSVSIPAESLELPFGVRLISIQPSRVQVELGRTEVHSAN